MEQRLRSIVAASFLIVAAGASFALQEKRPAHAPFAVGEAKVLELGPGQAYTVNFVTSGAANISAEFASSPGAIDIYAVTHPRSELQETPGQLNVSCRGLTAVPHRIAHTQEVLPAGSFEFRIRERGHFGLLFHNARAEAAHVEVTIRLAEGQVVFTSEGPTAWQELRH